MGSALGGMLAELLGTNHALWLREAELAAGVPVVAGPDESEHLAVRLQAVLKSGAESVDCPAAGLYLLDEATTSLKLRSSFGMPRERLSEPARPLQGALADLEAMLGHAVVLNDLDRQTHWNPPEDFTAAVCVPVCTPTIILGTLWVFSNEPRDFTDRETNLIEVIAGRLASDLERENLLREGVDSSQWKKDLSAVQRLQRNQLPTIAPLLEGWDVAGWTDQADTVGGDFFDWFALPDGLLAVAVADVMADGVEAAFGANTVKAATRAHGQYHRSTDAMLKAVNMTLMDRRLGRPVRPNVLRTGRDSYWYGLLFLRRQSLRPPPGRGSLRVVHGDLSPTRREPRNLLSGTDMFAYSGQCTGHPQRGRAQGEGARRSCLRRGRDCRHTCPPPGRPSLNHCPDRLGGARPTPTGQHPRRPNHPGNQTHRRLTATRKRLNWRFLLRVSRAESPSLHRGGRTSPQTRIRCGNGGIGRRARLRA